MPQYEMNLRDHWLIVRRRRVTIVAAMLLSALLSFWMAKQKVPVYEATAAVKFEQSTSLSGLLVEVLSYSTADSIETQASLIKSYPVLEEVARRLGRLPPAAPGQALRESKTYTASLNSISAMIRTTRVPNTSILEITAASPNPREARDLANTVAETYRDYNRAVRNARITEARKFIEAQLRDVDIRVKRSEEEVWAFREANRIIAPGAESTVLLSLFTQLRSDIEKTRQVRTELELAQTRLGRSDPNSLNERVFVESVNPALQKLQATQVELLLERNNLALEVTDRHPRLHALDERMREVRAEMRREVGAQIALLRHREDILNRQMGDVLQKNREIPSIELGLQRLQRDAKVNADMLTLLKTKHQEALIKESEGIEEVTIIRPAAEPGAPIGGEIFNTVFIGAVAGLLVGLVFAYVQETLDTSIGTIEDVESYLQVPVLGVVPHIDARETVQRLVERRPALAEMEPEALQSHALLITHFDPKSPVAEAYRTLRTRVQFGLREHGGKILVVTSPTLQEGKTTTIVNLAITMAQNGQRTLLVGANLRRPSIHRFFGIEREPGLSDVLVGNARWRDCIRTVADILMGRFEMEDIMASPGLDNLHILESGPIPANPSELLSTPAMSRFLSEVREAYDVVLIDTPPVLPVTDSAIVAGQVDGVVLVYQAGKVGRLVLKRAKAHLESARAKVWGVVLNDLQGEIAGYTYAHYYTHYYGEETTETTAGPLRRLLDTARGRLRGSGARPRSQPPSASSPAPVSEAKPERRPSRRHRNVGIGVVVLVVLLGAALAMVVWQLGWLGGGQRPRDAVRRKLDSPPPPIPSVPPPPTSQRLVPSEADDRPGPAVTFPAPSVAPPAALPAAPVLSAAPPPSPPSPSAEDPPAAADLAPASPALIASVPPASAPRAATPPAAVPTARFAVEFGPFAAQPDADRIERQLNLAGHPTVRFRQQTGAGLFAVLVERGASGRDPEALVSLLRDQGFPEATVGAEGTGENVRVGEPMVLRGAVKLAERLRARGHPVRIAVQPGEAVTFLIRHGNFIMRQDAEAKRVELARLGLPSHVVRVR